MQHHYRHHSHRLLAGMALYSFPLQVLQEPICEVILGPLAPCFPLTLRPAMWTNKFHHILLRIAVQSSPARAAHSYDFWDTLFHGGTPPRIHVQAVGCNGCCQRCTERGHFAACRQNSPPQSVCSL